MNAPLTMNRDQKDQPLLGLSNIFPLLWCKKKYLCAPSSCFLAQSSRSQEVFYVVGMSFVNHKGPHYATPEFLIGRGP